MIWHSFKPLVWIVALGGAVLLLLAGMVSQDWTKFIVPPPENTAEQLITALSAHRYEGAINQLSQELQQEVSQQDLGDLVKAIERSPAGGIQDAHGQTAEVQNNQATADVEVTRKDNQKVTVTLPLQKENGQWKVSSLEPIQALAGKSSFSPARQVDLYSP